MGHQVGYERPHLFGVNSPAQLWMTIDDPDFHNVTMHYTFNTPVGAAPASQCGKVLFDDFHVEAVTTTDGTPTPRRCVDFPASVRAGP